MNRMEERQSGSSWFDHPVHPVQTSLPLLRRPSAHSAARLAILFSWFARYRTAEV